MNSTTFDYYSSQTLCSALASLSAAAVGPINMGGPKWEIGPGGLLSHPGTEEFSRDHQPMIPG